MNIKFKFDGPSCCSGVVGALVATEQASPWFMLFAILLLFDLPGPKMSFSSKGGWSFTWWSKPLA